MYRSIHVREYWCSIKFSMWSFWHLVPVSNGVWMMMSLYWFTSRWTGPHIYLHEVIPIFFLVLFRAEMCVNMQSPCVYNHENNETESKHDCSEQCWSCITFAHTDAHNTQRRPLRILHQFMEIAHAYHDWTEWHRESWSRIRPNPSKGSFQCFLLCVFVKLLKLLAYLSHAIWIFFFV